MAVFCAFLDVMGVQHRLTPVAKNSRSVRQFKDCQQMLAKFHHDLQLAAVDVNFVAEFSDCVYLVDDRLATVAAVAIHMIRLSLLNGYPIRGGIGSGTFWHESTGVRTNARETFWSTSSFMGGAVVSSYQASDSQNAPGLRVLVHPAVMRRNTEAYLKVLTVPLVEEQQSDTASHELRCFAPSDVTRAIELLQQLEAKQDMPEQARRHYTATVASIQRMSDFKKVLPFTTPALRASSSTSLSNERG